MTLVAEEWRISSPPPEVYAPVQAVAQTVRGRSLNAEDFRLSTPPADSEAPVKAVAHALRQPVRRAQAQNSGANGQLPPGLKEADYSETIGDDEDPAGEPPAMAQVAALDTQAIYRIIREVALADSGEALYSAVSADREYQTSAHLAYQSRRFGLGFGLVLFTQESGRLGSVLRLMRQRDPASFEDIFAANAEALLAVTNAATTEARLAPVGGEPLWSQAWTERFRRAGEVAAFQAAQNEEAIEGQFRPMLRVAADLGLTSDRALAMVYDRVVTRGLGGGLRWVVSAAGVLRTMSQRQTALRLVGANDVLAFQQAVAGLPKDGRFGPATHAALVAALRERDLVPLPTTAELIARLVAAADGTARTRLERLRDSQTLSD